MIPPHEEWHLDTRRLGRRVLVFEQLDSTNNLAAALAREAPEDGIVVLADEQTAGRGQYGRSWLAPRGQSVLLSLLLFPPPQLYRPALLTAWAAVSVCTLLRGQLGLAPRIKWPNDVLLEGRKVCGILIETHVQQGTSAAVVGIGLNVRQSGEQLAAAGLPGAVSLQQMGQSLEPRQLAVDLLRQLDEDHDRLSRGELHSLEASWRDYLGLVGRAVVAVGSGVEYRGRLLELGFDGVVLNQAEGGPLILEPERIQSLLALESP
jgi:BirA family biotin operon repressor/biotin-[acetyl-CoA-carboxylase] ligase